MPDDFDPVVNVADAPEDPVLLRRWREGAR